jgi:hypothetical protein
MTKIKNFINYLLQFIYKLFARKTKSQETKEIKNTDAYTFIKQPEEKIRTLFIPRNLTPKEYGRQLQQIGKQKWIKKQSK